MKSICKRVLSGILTYFGIMLILGFLSCAYAEDIPVSNDFPMHSNSSSNMFINGTGLSVPEWGFYENNSYFSNYWGGGDYVLMQQQVRLYNGYVDFRSNFFGTSSSSTRNLQIYSHWFETYLRANSSFNALFSVNPFIYNHIMIYDGSTLVKDYYTENWKVNVEESFIVPFQSGHIYRVRFIVNNVNSSLPVNYPVINRNQSISNCKISYLPPSLIYEESYYTNDYNLVITSDNLIDKRLWYYYHNLLGDDSIINPEQDIQYNGAVITDDNNIRWSDNLFHYFECFVKEKNNDYVLAANFSPYLMDDLDFTPELIFYFDFDILHSGKFSFRPNTSLFDFSVLKNGNPVNGNSFYVSAGEQIRITCIIKDLEYYGVGNSNEWFILSSVAFVKDQETSPPPLRPTNTPTAVPTNTPLPTATVIPTQPIVTVLPTDSVDLEPTNNLLKIIINTINYLPNRLIHDFSDLLFYLFVPPDFTKFLFDVSSDIEQSLGFIGFPIYCINDFIIDISNDYYDKYLGAPLPDVAVASGSGEEISPFNSTFEFTIPEIVIMEQVIFEEYHYTFNVNSLFDYNLRWMFSAFLTFLCCLSCSKATYYTIFDKGDDVC